MVICCDGSLKQKLDSILNDIGLVSIVRNVDRYPISTELLRSIRACAPHLIFLDVESLPKALELAKEVEKHAPGVQIMAVSAVLNPQVLLDLMRGGVREFASAPFERQSFTESLMRISEALQTKPVEIDATDNVFSFLPSKAGVGTSTIAMNAAMALSRIPNASVLLSDFDLNSGMIRFMLKLDNQFSVTDAVEHSHEMDESLWPQMVTTVQKLDVLHAGKMQPDYRIEPTQVRHLVEFMRRNYQALCFDLSGNLEKYSIEIMHESKKIFLVCTPEIPSLHLAREKYLYLKQLDLGSRVGVLLTRYQKRALMTPEQIQEILGLPIQMTFTNDYQGVHRAMTAGRWMDPSSDFGKQCTALANSMMEVRNIHAVSAPPKKSFLEYFAVVPARVPNTELKKPAV
jgi:pilus assembly protein CpaE